MQRQEFKLKEEFLQALAIKSFHLVCISIIFSTDTSFNCALNVALIHSSSQPEMSPGMSFHKT